MRALRFAPIVRARRHLDFERADELDLLTSYRAKNSARRADSE